MRINFMFNKALICGLTALLTSCQADQTSSITTDSKRESTDVTLPITSDTHVVIYTNQRCSFCTKSKEIMTSKGIKFTEIEVNTEAKLDEMEKVTGKRTVPQIVVNGKYKGSYKDLFWAEMFNKMAEFFESQPNTAPAE